MDNNSATFIFNIQSSIQHYKQFEKKQENM